MARYKLPDGTFTNNSIDTWLTKTEEELQVLMEEGLLPPYVQEALEAQKQSKKASANQGASPKQQPRKKSTAKKAAVVAEDK